MKYEVVLTNEADENVRAAVCRENAVGFRSDTTTAVIYCNVEGSGCSKSRFANEASVSSGVSKSNTVMSL